MTTKTITISVKKDVEERFRKLASITYGKRKGYLGKAVTEAMKEWENRKKNKADVSALAMLKKGFKMGKIKSKKRSDWHER